MHNPEANEGPTSALDTEALETQELRSVSEDETLGSPYPNQNSGLLDRPSAEVTLQYLLGEPPQS